MNYLAEESDRERIVAAVRLVRQIAKTRAFAPYVKEECLPGPGVVTDDEILQFVRENGSNCFHVTSSCRMGTDADAVVDPQLCVHGLSGLRIADASIMPTLISGNTNATVIMIGEKAADMILGDA